VTTTSANASGAESCRGFLNGRLIAGTEAGGRDSILGVNLPQYAAPAFADLRGTGKPDLFAGGAGGGVVYYRRLP